MTAEQIACLNHYSQLFVGFSGGLDSTVLMHYLASSPALSAKLSAVYVNHGLSPNALLWQNHCQQISQSLGVRFIAQQVHIDNTSNLEERARTARYEVFNSLVKANECLILAHHQNDQAETVLLNLLRGAGVDGLAAMSEYSMLANGNALIRPLLFCSRSALEAYAAEHQLRWIDDESNQDEHYSRNFLRQTIIPLLQDRWPAAIENIARTSNHCQQAKENLNELALLDCPELSSIQNSLHITSLLVLSPQRITNVLRAWLRKNKVKSPSAAVFARIINEVLYAKQDAMPLVDWEEHSIRRYKDKIYLDTKPQSKVSGVFPWPNFPNPLHLGGTDYVSAVRSTSGLVLPENATLEIAYRHGGATLKWHGQTKELKKLFQQWSVPPWMREYVPLLYVNGQLAAVVGYAISDDFFSRDSAWAWDLIRV